MNSDKEWETLERSCGCSEFETGKRVGYRTRQLRKRITVISLGVLFRIWYTEILMNVIWQVFSFGM